MKNERGAIRKATRLGGLRSPKYPDPEGHKALAASIRGHCGPPDRLRILQIMNRISSLLGLTAATAMAIGAPTKLGSDRSERFHCRK